MKSTCLFFLVLLLSPWAAQAQKAGTSGKVGCLENPKAVARLQITEPGVYENYLVDSKWDGGNRVKITADNVTLRHCEIRNATGNGVGVFGKHVTIENCRIHHLLAGSFMDQKDAHGITGHWEDVTIRNCEIYYTSGDSVQFDPERNSAGQVTIENCTFWSGPLPEDAASFHRGEIPGENAVDTKVKPTEPNRCRLVIRHCYFHGWRQPGQVNLMAALNLKEHIFATVEGCVFDNNQVAFRLRGPGERGGALVEMTDCAIYNGDIGVRVEDKIESLKIVNLTFSEDVKLKYQHAGGGLGPGYVNTGEGKALPLAERVSKGSERKGE